MSDTVTTLRNAAVTAHRAGQHDRAVELYTRFLAVRPSDAGMWSNYGALMRAMSRHDIALMAHQRAYALDPDAAGVRNNYANLLSDVGAYDQSIALRKEVLAKTPGDAAHKTLIGRCLRGQGNYAEAVAWLDKHAPDHPNDPEFDMQRAFALLGAGEYAAGFDAYRARWNTDELTPRQMSQPEWKGEDLSGKRLLVLPEQGQGDTVLFARFLPQAQASGAQVIFAPDRPLSRLLSRVAGADEIAAPTAPADVWCNLVDLAGPHFAAGGAVPAPPQLTIPDDSRERARNLIAPHSGLKIGVNWCGSVTYKANAFRSFSHRHFTALADLPGLQMFSLYKGPEAQALRADGSAAFIVDAAATDRDFADCAALMDEMDLIITSDTATAHIAGALGKPTWVLLHWDPFWVYRHTGNKTEWYPKMRLFRQPKPQDWDSVFAKVRRNLEPML